MGGLSSALEETIGANEALKKTEGKVQYEFDRNQWTFGEFKTTYNIYYGTNVCTDYKEIFFETTLIRAIKNVAEKKAILTVYRGAPAASTMQRI